MPIGERTFDTADQRQDRREGKRHEPHPARKLASPRRPLAGCFGCHMSFLDIDEHLFELVDRGRIRPLALTDIKDVGPATSV